MTCLYSADRVPCVTGAPHSLQNLAVAPNWMPHDLRSSPTIVSAPRPASTPVSFHRWSDLSVISALSCDVCRLCGYCLPIPLADGTKFAGYTILQLLGSDRMGGVYLAKHPRLPRHDALKVLPEDVSADPDYRERFLREADLAAALWHPNIVGVHDRGEYVGTALDRDGLRR